MLLFLNGETIKPSLFHVVNFGALSIHQSPFFSVDVLSKIQASWHLLPKILQWFPTSFKVQIHWHGFTVFFTLSSFYLGVMTSV